MNLLNNGPSEHRTFGTTDLRNNGASEKRAVPITDDLPSTTAGHPRVSSQVPKFPSSRNFKYRSSHVSKFPSSRNFKFPSFEVSGNSSSEVPVEKKVVKKTNEKLSRLIGTASLLRRSLLRRSLLRQSLLRPSLLRRSLLRRSLLRQSLLRQSFFHWFVRDNSFNSTPISI